ncbi:MAG: ankyrin repeat domain-containing protein [Candidatus Thiodiazotropha taylori]|uniref:Ankyrin repeat domain-containing protein n=1 Tax=Candidatus Thiodiazotropha taylori TaxID=2792791 RepID=A0A9E4T437_9GAMM|nr:ankyrin repeat domain-containing protein [Candidatus Thiodiazotropha taylori]MCG8040170.1 ankyrin repeat domain-containing protein [Candidatus Thiodiazotropha taylori]MCW4258666.1 ankyrin repeat domain-containing protein [Candidatus Thiodiazotropha taylori]MCW4320450.1 ankyrin repeat domain-containing protein [Candidatus Thiodiazotropha taylori]
MLYRIAIIVSLCVLVLSACSKQAEPTITLSRAVQIGDIDQLERNLHWGADVNKADTSGLTPLHVAAQKGSLVMSRILVKNQADLEAVDPRGHTPVLKALIARNPIIAEFLVEKGAKIEPNSALHETAALGSADRDVVGFLIKKGAKLDNQDEKGNTPLHSAILNDQRVSAKYLINRGASLDIANQEGLTPLGLAKQKGNQDIIRMLIQFGASEDR